MYVSLACRHCGLPDGAAVGLYVHHAALRVEHTVPPQLELPIVLIVCTVVAGVGVVVRTIDTFDTIVPRLRLCVCLCVWYG
jgi:hypothetical protein